MGIITRLFLCITILNMVNMLNMVKMDSNTYSNTSNRSSAPSLGSLKLLSWNATGIMSSGSYLGRVLENLNIDICGISEHWLYRNDLHFLDSINSSYKYAAVSDFDLEKPSKRKVGKGGVAMFWKADIDSRISLLNIDDDRIMGVQYQLSKDRFVYIIQVYLPSANHSISQLEDYLTKLQDICSMYTEMGTLVIMGDLNVHINGRLFLKPPDRRSALFHHFTVANNMLSLNTLPLCAGASSTFVLYSGEHVSMIDHILLQVEKVDLVSECSILDDDALNVSNHRPIYCHSSFPHVEQAESGLSVRRSVNWRCAKSDNLENFRNEIDRQCLNIPQDILSSERAHDIDVLYANVCDIIIKSSEKHLPYR